MLAQLQRNALSVSGFLAVYAYCKKSISGIPSSREKLSTVRRAVRDFSDIFISHLCRANLRIFSPNARIIQSLSILLLLITHVWLASSMGETHNDRETETIYVDTKEFEANQGHGETYEGNRATRRTSVDPFQLEMLPTSGPDSTTPCAAEPARVFGTRSRPQGS